MASAPPPAAAIVSPEDKVLKELVSGCSTLSLLTLPRYVVCAAVFNPRDR